MLPTLPALLHVEGGFAIKKENNILTDRSRAEDFSNGKLKGGTEKAAESYDAMMEFTSTTNFGGINRQNSKLSGML